MAACCECIRTPLFSDPKELKRLRRNWINHFAVTSLGGVCFFISIPSLHQFVTSSSHPTDTNVQPGLGLSETWYTWIVSISSLGELVGAVCFGLLSRTVYVKWLLLVALMIGFLGGLSFGIGHYGWMLLVGRMLIGLFQGAQQTLWRLYIAETSGVAIKLLPVEMREKSTLKYTNFFLSFATATTSIAAGPALASIVAQISAIDQFRWPGWFICVAAFTLIILTLILYREKWTDTNKVGGACGLHDVMIPYYAMALIIMAFFFLNWQFAVLDTLLNPILADNFGLEIEYISYTFMSLLVLYLVGVSFVYLFKQLRVNIRIISLISLFLGLTGSVIATDWQSISGLDPCTQATPTFNETQLLSSLLLSNDSCYSLDLIQPISSDLASMSCDYISCDDVSCDILRNLSTQTTDDVTMATCLWISESQLVCYEPVTLEFLQLTLLDTNNKYYEDMIDAVEGSGYLPDHIPCVVTHGNHDNALFVSFLRFPQQPLSCDINECVGGANTSQCACEGSGEEGQCFWNPQSRLTGKYCERCRPVCLSRDHTISFGQLIAGTFLLSLVFAMGRMCLTILLSDGLGEASQGPVMGIMVAVGAIARFTGPLWGNAAYIFAGHRTWLVMMVLSSCQAVIIALFVVFYKTLTIKTSDSSLDDDLSLSDDIDISGRGQQVQLLVFNVVEDDEDGCHDDETHLDSLVDGSDGDKLLA